MQIQTSWLLQKPTDLDLHCFLRRHVMLSKRRVNTICRQCWPWSDDILSSVNAAFDLDLHCLHRPVFPDIWSNMTCFFTWYKIKSTYLYWQNAVSMYCRLGFAKKKGAELNDEDLHPTWRQVKPQSKKFVFKIFFSVFHFFIPEKVF